MENQPTQQGPPLKPPANTAGKTSGSSGQPTPAWLWLLLLGGFALIFYQFVPKAETSVLYYPWFHDQVQADNIKAITIQNLEIRGELRREQSYESVSNQQPLPVRRFVTNAPSDASLDAVVQKLIQLNDKKTAEAQEGVARIRIDSQPPTSASGPLWIMMLLPAFIILMFLYLFVRRGQVRRDDRNSGLD
jgi:cell division protease FtsH